MFTENDLWGTKAATARNDHTRSSAQPQGDGQRDSPAVAVGLVQLADPNQLSIAHGHVMASVVSVGCQDKPFVVRQSFHPPNLSGAETFVVKGK